MRDAAGTYEAPPETPAGSAWPAFCYRLPQPRTLAPGDGVRIHGMHDRFKLTVWGD